MEGYGTSYPYPNTEFHQFFFIIRALLLAVDLLHILALHHIMQFRNFYLVFLRVSQCQGIAPCYAILELIDFLEISRD